MVGESRKWVMLVASIWIQAFTGTNFDFSSYSSELKSVLDITQLQLNYLSVASDMGKAFGWCSGLSLMFFPLWVVMFMAAFLGLVGYGFQWLLIHRFISLPYALVFFLCLIAGCSICWFNTICYVLCIKHFPANRSLALSLGIGFNGLSAALYTLIANAINSNDDTLYLLLNAIVPLLISGLVLIPILHQPQPQPHSADTIWRDSSFFLCLNILALVTGLYLLISYSFSSSTAIARAILVGAIFLLVLFSFLPAILKSREWSCFAVLMRFSFYSRFPRADPDDNELYKELIGIEDRARSQSAQSTEEKECCLVNVLEREQITMLGEEHSTKLLISRWDFWLYYIAYFCGGTIGLVYSNNLGQISQSLGQYSQTSSLVTLYSTCSFFGRLLAAAPDFLSRRIHFARTGWFAVALVPTPIAFILLSISGSEPALHIGTGLIGLSSGFVFSAAVSITSELFGANSVGLNHNILITNIPLGSCLYGLLAALVYDSNGTMNSSHAIWLQEMSMCMGRKCYLQTFIWWSCISMVGLASSFLLFLRTKQAYHNFERNSSNSDRNRTETM
ncbi:protein NUCLEAR FUSION DEFECTIVE 4 [Cajanus cajan]|uniref:Transporter MCH1 n=1 Tax=Cajanus cajan TaxID=3821 RepID=A0A151RFC0_CAJCA|nr:protein NUCLEAR FUSION DEFECTIVE 4 [Cajanus cajan]KYP41334.1 putative transporter MCH1 [Cajanus cajan]